jgi:DnaJ-class molecular chaperone
MFKRVNVDGPGDDPDEYWFECDDCEGTGQVSFPSVDDDGNVEEGVDVTGTCPGCDGTGSFLGDADTPSE